jgi:hypothetical protein
MATKIEHRAFRVLKRAIKLGWQEKPSLGQQLTKKKKKTKGHESIVYDRLHTFSNPESLYSSRIRNTLTTVARARVCVSIERLETQALVSYTFCSIVHALQNL